MDLHAPGNNRLSLPVVPSPLNLRLNIAYSSDTKSVGFTQRSRRLMRPPWLPSGNPIRTVKLPALPAG